jgi:hypothetical protein
MLLELINQISNIYNFRSTHVDQHGLQGIVTVSYKTYRNTYQISRYVWLVEKVYRYTPT